MMISKQTKRPVPQRRILLVAALLITVLISACKGSGSDENATTGYVAEIHKWRVNRVQHLTAPDGWLSLAGLFELEEGTNTIGANALNKIVFPAGKAPEYAGRLILRNGKAVFESAPHVQVFHDSVRVEKIELQDDHTGKPTILTLGPLSWFVIKRTDKYFIRLRDHDSENLNAFQGIDTYPIDPAWRLPAKLEPFSPPRTIPVPNILGMTTHQPSPGALQFTIGGTAYSLIAIGDSSSKELFVIFADETSGVETYGGGRFLYVKTPGPDGKTVIDFNKAYNPPCAFTEFATCPLPPEGNRLPIAVTAGEKNYAGATH